MAPGGTRLESGKQSCSAEILGIKFSLEEGEFRVLAGLQFTTASSPQDSSLSHQDGADPRMWPSIFGNGSTGGLDGLPRKCPIWV
jgi:hypothetical protein